MPADQISNPQDAEPDEAGLQHEAEEPRLVIHGTAHLSATSQTEVGE